MQPQGWTKFLFVTLLLTFAGANRRCIGVDVAWVDKLNDSGRQQEPIIKYFAHKKQSDGFYQKNQFKTNNFNLWQSQLLNSPATKNLPSNTILQTTLIAQANSETRPETEPTPPPNPAPQNPPSNTQESGDAPQLEGDFPQSSPMIIEELLNKPSENRTDKLEILRRLLRERQQPNPQADSQRELDLRIREKPLPQQKPSDEANSLPEINLRVRPRTLPQQKQPPPRQQPAAKFKPIGSLYARVGYFHTNNIFSSEIFPREDGLIFYGLSLASAYFPVGSKTYINGSINGNLIRYMEQSRFNYNQISFNVGIYQQLSPRMYGRLDFNNQKFFYANSTDRFQSGDRFLDESSVRLFLGRRDPLNSRLALDSYYELSANFAEPNNRSRIINSFFVSLNYYLQKPLLVGINYQVNLSDFTQRQRDDNYHRLYGNVIYRVSDSSSLNLQSGISFGGSSDRNINFDGWFVNVSYNLKVGEF